MEFDFMPSLDKVFGSINFSENSGDFQNQVKLQRNQFLEALMAIYKPRKIHPWMLFLQNNMQKIKYNFVSKSKAFMRQIYVPLLFKLKESFGKIEFLELSDRASNENLEALKQKVILQISNSNQSLAEDLQKKHENQEFRSNLEDAYYKILTSFDEIFEKIQNKISLNRKVLTNSFMLDIDDLSYKIIGPEINQIIFSSKLNNEVSFLDSNYNIVFAKLYDLGLVLNLWPIQIDQIKLVKFDFLDEKFYQKASNLMVI